MLCGILLSGAFLRWSSTTSPFAHADELAGHRGRRTSRTCSARRARSRSRPRSRQVDDHPRGVLPEDPRRHVRSVGEDGLDRWADGVTGHVGRRRGRAREPRRSAGRAVAGGEDEQDEEATEERIGGGHDRPSCNRCARPRPRDCVTRAQRLRLVREGRTRCALHRLVARPRMNGTLVSRSAGRFETNARVGRRRRRRHALSSPSPADARP